MNKVLNAVLARFARNDGKGARVFALLCALVVTCAVGFAALSAKAAEQGAPRPYPQRIEDWPGQGEVRLFEWMPVLRHKFWEARQASQGGVVFTGDSLTELWENLATDFAGLHVVNRAIGGEVSRGLLFRFDEDVLSLHPRGIVVLIGTNDLTASQPASLTIANLREMLELRQAQAPGVPVLLNTLPASANPEAPFDKGQQREINAGLYELARRYPKVFVVDLFAATANAKGQPDPRYYEADLHHFSPAGYVRWKQVLLPVMHEAGIL
jgi:lysophospholipase L1-like esterase